MAVPLKTPGDFASKGPFVLLESGNPLKAKNWGFKQGVCLWKHRSAIHFQLS